jgi:hypothetical protein
MLAMLSEFTKKREAVLIDELLAEIHKKLALEILKKQLFKDLSEEELEHSSAAQQLILKILEPASVNSSKNSRYRLKAEFNYPVIGIGAPVEYFLPEAGKLINAKVIIPPNADVANALGAITSHIMIRQKLVISPNSTGNYVVEGVAGNQSFKNLDKAEAWSVEYLKKNVRSQALKAGTTRKTIDIQIDDRVVDTGNGLSLFLYRSITATLCGRPDLVAPLEKCLE